MLISEMIGSQSPLPSTLRRCYAIPWELGLADGQKSASSVALFPVVETATETKWAEQEYLGLYRRILWGTLEGYDKQVWMVYDHHTNTATHLRKWLRGY